ncbi:MAG: twin-arginine translocation signal domain-containing protein [Candidatus Levybacteria bacterium]|nr:twin-arginine translocation signal domain-containing protein [Candidatus Levybacteria bacterium]
MRDTYRGPLTLRSRRDALKYAAVGGAAFAAGRLTDVGSRISSAASYAVDCLTPSVDIAPATTSETLSLRPEIKQMAAEAFASPELGFPDWKSMYLIDVSPDMAKVQYTSEEEGKKDTASEVMGYGMIYAVHAGEKDTFYRLWNYAKTQRNEAGLMSWLIGEDDKPIDTSSAADADLDMAYALVAANMKWGGYEDDAREMMDNILRHDIEEGTFVLKGGYNWGGSDETNPSYYSPGYYKLFEDYTGNSDWSNVASAGRAVLDAIHERRGTLLPPNWSTADGDVVPGRGNNNDKYGYEAIRVPWRQGMAALWYPEDPVVGGHAKEQLKRINDFFEIVVANPNDIKGGYNPETGEALVGYTEVAFTGTAAVAASVSENPEFQVALLQNTIDERNRDWVTNESMRLNSILLLSGEMIH